MPVTISRALRAQLLKHAASLPEEEVCGLIFGTEAHISQIVPCQNVAQNRRTRFEIDPSALIAAHKAARSGGDAIIGSYHSHPNGAGQPSITDMNFAGGDASLMLIVAQGTVSAWSVTRLSAKPVALTLD
jgi:desampylase